MSVIAFEWNEIIGVGDELVKIRAIREIAVNSPYFIEHNSRDMPPEYKYNAEDFIGRLIWYMYVANRVAYTVSYKDNADIFPANEDNPTQYNEQEALDKFSSLMYNIYTQGGQVFLSEEWLSVAQEIKEYAQKNDPNYAKGGLTKGKVGVVKRDIREGKTNKKKGDEILIERWHRKNDIIEDTKGNYYDANDIALKKGVDYAKGGEVKKKGNEMIMGGLAGVLFGFLLNR